MPDGQSQQPFRDSDEYDVNGIHQRIVSRERPEPKEGSEKTPMWVWIVDVVFLFAMGYYLGRYGGSWGTIAHEVEQPQVAYGASVKKEVKGDLVFAGICQPCHQATGQGIPGQYPPLAGSEWLLKDAQTPIRIVLYGLEGGITVRGNQFVNKMPFFYDKLTTEEIAAALTFVRSSWGNKAPAVRPEDVAAIRSELGTRSSWNSAELTALRTTR